MQLLFPHANQVRSTSASDALSSPSLLTIARSPCSQYFGCSYEGLCRRQLLCNPRNYEDSRSQTRLSDLIRDQSRNTHTRCRWLYLYSYTYTLLVDEEDVLTFESMAEDVLQDGNEVNQLRRGVIYRLETGAVQQSLHWKPGHGACTH